MTNQFLERTGSQERVDHRSHAERGLDEQPTIHEGVAARAMEKKGIVSDRCELNRQIKTDNALLRELKSLVKKLMDAVKNTIPAIADAMEAICQKMIIFRYQLLHIRAGKKHFTDSLQVIQPDIKRYEDIVGQLKAKIQERHTLLKEKKAIPAIQVFRHRELARKIASLTEDIAELKSEKALLLNQFNCADNHGMIEVKQHIASMESSLEKLSQQEGKYTAELDAALKQYSELQQQAADMDSTELEAARQAIRPGKESEMVQRLQTTYQKRFDFRLLTKSQKDVADLLGEIVEPVSIQQKLQQSQQKECCQSPRKERNQER